MVTPPATHTMGHLTVPLNSHLHHRRELLQIHFIEALFIDKIPAKPLLIILGEDLAQIKGQESAIQQYL